MADFYYKNSGASSANLQLVAESDGGGEATFF